MRKKANKKKKGCNILFDDTGRTGSVLLIPPLLGKPFGNTLSPSRARAARFAPYPSISRAFLLYGAITTIQEFSGGNATGYAQISTARNQTNGWETVIFDFVTSSQAEAIRIDIMYANNPGTVLWDDFSITEKEAYRDIVATISHSFDIDLVTMLWAEIVSPNDLQV